MKQSGRGVRSTAQNVLQRKGRPATWVTSPGHKRGEHGEEADEGREGHVVAGQRHPRLVPHDDGAEVVLGRVVQRRGWLRRLPQKSEGAISSTPCLILSCLIELYRTLLKKPRASWVSGRHPRGVKKEPYL